MNKKCKIGFIGCGKMASAIIKGTILSKFLPKENIKGSEVNCEIAELASQRLGIEVITDNRALVMESDIIFIATKPNYAASVLEEIKDELTPDKLLVSICAGVSTSKIEKIIGMQRVVRVMPNTPALVLEGMSGVCKGAYANEEDAEFVIELLSNIGKAVEVTETQKLGLDYEKSLELATQTAIGSAKMVMQRGEVPVQTLIDNVATKGGCTFVGISVMNNEHSDKLFYDVIDQTTKKASELGK